MNHKFCLISTKYVINPALIHIAHYITTDRTLKIEPAALLSQLSCWCLNIQYFQKVCMFTHVPLVFVKNVRKIPKSTSAPFLKCFAFNASCNYRVVFYSSHISCHNRNKLNIKKCKLNNKLGDLCLF